MLRKGLSSSLFRSPTFKIMPMRSSYHSSRNKETASCYYALGYKMMDSSYRGDVFRAVYTDEKLMHVGMKKLQSQLAQYDFGSKQIFDRMIPGFNGKLTSHVYTAGYVARRSGGEIIRQTWGVFPTKSMAENELEKRYAFALYPELDCYLIQSVPVNRVEENPPRDEHYKPRVWRATDFSPQYYSRKFYFLVRDRINRYDLPWLKSAIHAKLDDINKNSIDELITYVMENAIKSEKLNEIELVEKLKKGCNDLDSNKVKVILDFLKQSAYLIHKFNKSSEMTDNEIGSLFKEYDTMRELNKSLLSVKMV